MWAIEILAIFALLVTAIGLLYLICSLTILLFDGICEIKDRVEYFKGERKK